jgi:drug/metabolite transporter (DMT)-like permease
VGAAVGAAVGNLVGALEGEVVGNFVGAAVGLALGAKVGMPVGYAVNPYPYSERVTFEQTVALPVIAAAAVCRAPRETVRLLEPPPAETYMTSSLTRMKSLVEW